MVSFHYATFTFPVLHNFGLLPKFIRILGLLFTTVSIKLFSTLAYLVTYFDLVNYFDIFISFITFLVKISNTVKCHVRCVFTQNSEGSSNVILLLLTLNPNRLPNNN